MPMRAPARFSFRLNAATRDDTAEVLLLPRCGTLLGRSKRILGQGGTDAAILTARATTSPGGTEPRHRPEAR
jgi:hypothetical protein